MGGLTPPRGQAWCKSLLSPTPAAAGGVIPQPDPTPPPPFMTHIHQWVLPWKLGKGGGALREPPRPSWLPPKKLCLKQRRWPAGAARERREGPGGNNRIRFGSGPTSALARSEPSRFSLGHGTAGWQLGVHGDQPFPVPNPPASGFRDPPPLVWINQALTPTPRQCGGDLLLGSHGFGGKSARKDPTGVLREGAVSQLPGSVREGVPASSPSRNSVGPAAPLAAVQDILFPPRLSRANSTEQLGKAAFTSPGWGGCSMAGAVGAAASPGQGG